MTRCLPDVGLLLSMLSECSNQLMYVDPLVQQTAGYGVQHLCVRERSVCMCVCEDGGTFFTQIGQ